MSTPAIEKLRSIAEEHGAVGFKVNGAGGGGSAVILSAAGREHELRSALLDNNAHLLPCKLNFHGLQTWEP